MQLVPAAGDGVLHVLAGASDAVRQRGRELYQAAWACQVARPASLVVAAIEGGPQQQTAVGTGRLSLCYCEISEDRKPRHLHPGRRKSGGWSR